MNIEQLIDKTETNRPIDITHLANPEILHHRDNLHSETCTTKIRLNKPNKNQLLIETYEDGELKFSDLFYLDDKEGINKSLRFQLGR